MKLSTRVRYGVRAMVELAKQPTDTPVALGELARRQEISPKYLEQMVTALKSGGLVESVRGSEGGYRLGRPAGEITVWDIYSILDASAAPIDCKSDPCDRLPYCSMRKVWEEMTEAIRMVLQSWSLEKLAKLETEEQEKYLKEPNQPT